MHRSRSNYLLPFFEENITDKGHLYPKKSSIVNVASVPQRSPFRYPGGKTWLVPRLREWLGSLPKKPKKFIEPFAGGGIISLTVAFEDLANKIIMVEIDEDVASVWRTILGNDSEWLASKILSFQLCYESAEAELNDIPHSIKKRAFKTLLRNRINHGGILAPGSGIIKHGENGKGILSRWYPSTLAKRIRLIQEVRIKIKFICGDGLAVMEDHKNEPDAVFFIDPPYTAPGKKAGVRLYSHNIVDHEALFKLAKGLAGDFLMTYDNAEGAIYLANKYGFDFETVPMKNTYHAEMEELLIGRDLDWARY